MTRVLVSVRSVAEARLVADAGADFVDLKEPRDGALGGLDLGTIRAIVDALRDRGDGARPGARSGSTLSATIGDLPMADRPAILARAAAVAACGVDYVKVGIQRDPAAAEVLDALAACDFAVVPVFIADRGLDGRLVERAAAAGFAAVMVDTADKRAGSLFDAVPEAELQRFVATVRRHGALAGLAGALRLQHLPALRRLDPDFAGFRSAVCAGDRSGALDAGCLKDLMAAMRAPAERAAAER